MRVILLTAITGTIRTPPLSRPGHLPHGNDKVRRVHGLVGQLEIVSPLEPLLCDPLVGRVHRFQGGRSADLDEPSAVGAVDEEGRLVRIRVVVRQPGRVGEPVGEGRGEINHLPPEILERHPERSQKLPLFFCGVNLKGNHDQIDKLKQLI